MSLSGRPIIDLDHVATWPPELLALLRTRQPRLLTERAAQTKYDLSSSMARKFGQRPDKPAWDEVTRLVGAEGPNWDLRVFHATRLLDIERVRLEGLKRLHLDEQLLRVKIALANAGIDRQVIDAMTVPTDDPMFRGREGVVFFAPSRHLLHDGGCDVFFRHFGGEAIQRIAAMAGEAGLAAVQSLGEPAVVVARIPALGWCTFADGRLPQSIIEHYPQAKTGCDASDHLWDVMISRDLPAANIESIVSPEHATVHA